jgi:hypothetical protein
MNFVSHIVRVDLGEDEPNPETGGAIFTPFGLFLFVGFLAALVFVYLVRTNLGRRSLTSEDWGFVISTSAVLSVIVDAFAFLIAGVIQTITNISIEPVIITVAVAAAFIALLFMAGPDTE